MCLLVALNGRGSGVAAVAGNLLRDPVAADGFRQKAPRGLCIAVLREQKVQGLALLISRALQRAPLALDLDGRLVHPPAQPHRTRTPMKRLVELPALLDDSAVHGGVLPLAPTFLHACFAMGRAQRVRPIPADAHEKHLWGDMGTVELNRPRRFPS